MTNTTVTPPVVACAAVTGVAVFGDAGNNALSVFGLTRAAFTALDDSEPESIRVFAGDGTDQITGSVFSEVLGGEAGTDTIAAGLGDDDQLVFRGTPGDDELNAVAGNGSLSVAGNVDSYTGVERFFLSGTAGNDTLTGAGGDDWLDGGAGVDELNGEGGTDRLSFRGSSGDDGLFATAGDGVLVAGAESAQYTSIEKFFLDGGGGNDFVVGSTGDDLLYGGAGDDDVTGDEGNDMLLGDTVGVTAAPGIDRLEGGGGDDELLGDYFDPGAVEVVVTLQGTEDVVPQAPQERVVTGAARKRVDTRSASELIVAVTALDVVGE